MAASAPTFVTTDGGVDMQESHNLDILPHLHDVDSMDKSFPMLEAPPAGVNIEDWEPDEGERERSTGKCSSHGELPGGMIHERLSAALAAW